LKKLEQKFTPNPYANKIACVISIEGCGTDANKTESATDDSTKTCAYPVVKRL
jgi:hypothetical protein